MADDIDLIKGRMTYEDDRQTTKLITVKNNTSATVNVGVECSFFQNDELTDTATMMIMNVKPDHQGF